MKISVLVPVFNVEAYVAECIESVVNQTHKDFELILVNDGSTDRSQAICAQYVLHHPGKIRSISTENKGPLHARSKAIEAATGDILVFLDGDDCLRNDALEQIAGCFHVHSCDMVLFNTGTCEGFPTREITHALENGAVFELASKKQLYRQLILGGIPNSVCLKALRADRAAIPEHLCRYHTKHGEDLLLSAWFITNCEKIVYLNEGLYHYRDRPGSAVHSFDIQRKESIKTVHTELEKCIAQWGMPELKPLHNARKVKGWIETLTLLLKNRSSMTGREFREQLRSMSEDPYFRGAYEAMEPSRLSRSQRILAFCLMKRQYFLFDALSNALRIVN